MDFVVTLVPRSRVPLHKQLYDELRHAILGGRLKAGARVPSTRDLARSLGVARATVTLSYGQLVSEGYLRPTTGSGTFVSGALPDELLRARPVASGRATARSREARRVDLSRYGASIADDVPFEPPERDAPITFKTGRPALEEFPLQVWRRLTLKHLRAGPSQLDYDPGSQGHRPLREAIAGYLRYARAVDCDADQVVIVGGAQQALDLVGKILIDRGDPVAIENPGYLGARRAFLAQGATLTPVPVDESGIVVDALARGSRRGLKFVYVTPSHQFPTGVTLSLTRRLELLAWAEQSGAVIVEDDYDSEFRFGARPIPALHGLRGGESVIYVGTFSKVLFPALRVGYVVAPPALARLLARAKWLADRQTPTVEQMVLADFITEGHFDRHLRRMRPLYGRRRETLVRALETHFAGRLTILGGAAGMHLMIRLRSRGADEEIARRARAAGVAMVSARLYYLGDERRRRDEFVLGYAGLSERRIREGIRRLAEIML